jgi:malonate transporter
MMIASLLVPNFLLILLGFGMRRWMGFSDTFWQHLERLVYYILFPTLLFLAVARSGPGLLAVPGLIETAALFTLGGMILGYLGKYLFRLKPRAFASGFQCAFRFSGYIGFAIMGGLNGEEGIAAIAVITSVLVPPVNAISIMVLARRESSSWVKEILQNPLVISTACGLLYSLTGFPIPPIADETLKLLSSAALPLGLIAVGAGFRWAGIMDTKSAVAYLVAVKLLAVPAIAFLAARMYGLQGVHLNTLIVLAALPTATNAYILAVRMGGDGPFVASIVTANILVAMATLPFWLKMAGI